MHMYIYIYTFACNDIDAEIDIDIDVYEPVYTYILCVYNTYMIICIHTYMSFK